MTTIDEVIHRMDEIVETCKRENLRAGYFAILYRLVTIRIKEGIEANEFEDNPRMEKLDVIFAKRFIDAFDDFYAQRETTQSWKIAFQAAEDKKYLVLQHLFLGMNAHINLDLGIAAVLTVEEQPLAEIHNDFNKINEVLASLVDEVKSNISKVSILFGWLIGFAKGRDEMLLNFSIGIARDGAWQFANDFYEHSHQDLCIKERDEKIEVIAHKLIHTGKVLSFLIKVIRFGEFRTEKRNMEILESAVEI